MSKIPVVVIAGPTASGKTALSIEVAKRFGAEIVSADSMQIYKYMDIGTAKPDRQEMCSVKHHMIDCVMPDEDFSVAQYAKMARNCISDIFSRGKIAVMVGGTGLYIDHVIKNIFLEDIDTDKNLREELFCQAQQNGNEFMHKKLAKIDPEAAAKIHPNNIRRVLRALEVYYASGKTFSQQNRNSIKDTPYDSIIFMPNVDRKTLYDRIDKRVDIMLGKGLYDEFCSLVDMGYTRKLNSMQAIGYKEFFYYQRGMCSFSEAAELIKKHTRNYAKRQMTWFKRNKDIIMLDSDDNMALRCIQIIENWLKTKQI